MTCGRVPVPAKRGSEVSAARTAPRMASASASEPEPVKTISDCSAPIRAATLARASSSAVWVRTPYACELVGLPHSLVRYGVIAVNTRGSTGVVALWSR